MTSKKAAARRNELYNWLRRQGPRGATTYEMACFLGCNKEGASRLCRELGQDGRFRKTIIKRPTDVPSPSPVWVAVVPEVAATAEGVPFVEVP